MLTVRYHSYVYIHVYTYGYIHMLRMNISNASYLLDV